MADPILNDLFDVVWLAGLAEGEATFDLHRGRYPRIRIAMTDRDVVGRAATLMGTRVRVTFRPKPYMAMWHAEASGDKAAEIMRALLPHMGSRRSAKIAEVLGAYDLRDPEAPRRIPGPALTRPPGLPMSPEGAR